MTKTRFIPLLTLSAVLITTGVQADQVEISLVDNLDGYLDSYCLDIKGGGKDINTSKGLQVHTCYSYKGALGKDQIFDTLEFEYEMLYLPKFDVCAELSHLSVGSNVALATCNSTAEQRFTFSGNGTITSTVEPTLCLTASLDTKLGRNGTSKHQIKGLTLENCTVDLAQFQTWKTNSQ
ncbi:MAG: RICIN domain-containing protein [Pseudomonadales bacterium]|nr:RICIN domain-containing protein [Pseudomonadales bacterium]